MTKFENVRKRIFSFALDVIDMCNKLPKSESNKIIARQVIRSATSIGANLEEAAGAYTKNDFIYGLNISKKETRETNYWLRLLAQSNPTLKSKQLETLITESEELLRILIVSVKNANTKS